MRKSYWRFFSYKKIVKAIFAACIVLIAVATPILFETEAEAANIQVKDVSAGSVVRFAGYDWIVLNPLTGYIVTKDRLPIKKAFDPDNTQIFSVTDVNNIAYYLNNDFYNSLPVTQKGFIQTKAWTIGGVPRNDLSGEPQDGTMPLPSIQLYESSATVDAKVGLLSISEWIQYSKHYTSGAGLIDNPSRYIWTRTPLSSYSSYVWYLYTDGTLNNTYANYSYASMQPAVYLAPDTEVNLNSAPVSVTIANQTTETGMNQIVDLNNYFTDVDGDTLTYTSSANDVQIANASINQNILTITPVSQGGTTITVMAADGRGGTASQTFTITVSASQPTAPNVTADDNLNKINGIDMTMEYQIGSGTWISYDSAAPPDLSGNQTVKVRVKANGAVPAGLERSLIFTVNPSSGGGGGSTQNPISEPTIDPLPVVNNSEEVKTELKDGKINIQIKDEKTGIWQPAYIEKSQSVGGYFVIQTGANKDGAFSKELNLPRNVNKVVVLNNDKPYLYFEAGTNIATNKKWDIKFSKAILNTQDNLKNIKVCDENGNEVAIKVTVSKDGKTVAVQPMDVYQKGKLFYISIDDITDLNGKKQNKPVRKIFITE